MLERHVNSHFTESSSSSAHSGPRKSIDGAPARKRLKRAGVKLKFRQLPFSARIFDFFDAGMMSGIRHQVAAMEKTSLKMFNMRNDSIEFHSKAISIRKDENGSWVGSYNDQTCTKPTPVACQDIGEVLLTLRGIVLDGRMVILDIAKLQLQLQLKL